MTTNRLWQLLLVAIVAVAIALWAERNRRAPTVAGTESELLFPGLNQKVNDVSQVTIKVGGDATAVTLLKGDARWTVAEKSGYYADIGKLRELLVNLAEAKLVEPKTAVADNYPRLGVEDVSATDATGVLLEIAGAGEPLRVIAGKAGTRSESTYVRRPGEDQSWLADKDLQVDSEALDWLDDQLVDIKANRIQQVDVVRADGQKLSAAKQSQADVNYAVANLPAGKVLTSPAAANAMAGVLAGLTFDDVVAAADFDTHDKTPAQVTYKGFDGLVIDAQAFELGENEYFAAFTARFDRDQAMRFYTAPPTQDDNTAAETDIATPEDSADDRSADVGADTPADDTPDGATVIDTPDVAAADFSVVEQEAAELSARLSGWIFRIPAYKHAQMNRTIADLVKDAE